MPLTTTTERLEYLRRLCDAPYGGPKPWYVQELLKEIDAQEARRMELAKENMALMADLSTANTQAANQRAAVEQFHRDCVGHNFCWQNARRLFTYFGLASSEMLQLPPMDERMHGCKMFWEALEADPARWPDFCPAGEKPCP